MPPVALIVLIYVLGVAVTWTLCADAIRRSPLNMPGGGWAAVGVTAVLWPVVLVAAVFGMLLSL
jgi:hypothetical protein